MDVILADTTRTTGPKGQPKPRKMRLSCDACSRAKVRCDKVRPACHRCGNMSMCCNYSPSMRLGKPRRNKISDGNIMRDMPSGPASGPETTGTYPVSRTRSHFMESSPEPTDPYIFGSPTSEFQCEGTSMASLVGSHSPGYYDADSNIRGWSAEEQMLLQTSEDDFAFLPPYSPSPSVSGHIRSTSLRSQPELFNAAEHWQLTNLTNPYPDQLIADTVIVPKKIDTSPLLTIPTSLLTPPVTAVVLSHDCTQFAFQTLSNLYMPSVIQPSNITAKHISGTLPTLDGVLSTTRTAVDRLSALLSCTCSSDQHFSTTIALSIQKILFWYQAIANTNCNECWCDDLTEAFVRTHNTQGLNEEDEDVYRTQLILGELRRVEKLIDKFSERYCTDEKESLFDALERQLRTRVRGTFKATMKVAPEDVKRKVAFRSSYHRARLNTM